MGKKLSPQVRDHLEWLGFIQPTGLVVSAHALVQAGAILNRRDIEGQELLKECIEERTVDPDREPEPYLPDFEVFTRHVLGWSFSPKGYAGTDSASIPEELELALPEYGETLRPDFVVRERDPAEDSPPWQLLVQVLEPGDGLGPSGRQERRSRSIAAWPPGAPAARHSGLRRAPLQRERHSGDLGSARRELRMDGLPRA